MRHPEIHKRYCLFFVLVSFLTVSCNPGSENFLNIDREPVIEPDYSGVTIPRNIAPLNFKIKEAGKSFRVTASSANGFQVSAKSPDGISRFPQKRGKNCWKKTMEVKSALILFLKIKKEPGQNLIP